MTVSFLNTNIRTEDDTLAHKAKGEETFTVELFTDIESERLVDTKSIDIFPVPSGKIEGLVADEVLNTLPSSVNFTVNDAYPGSEIYLEVVYFTNTPQEEIVRVEDTHRNIPLDSSTDSIQTINNFSNYNPQEDTSVVTRWVSKSIFGLEILDEVVNSIDRTLQVRGSINSF